MAGVCGLKNGALVAPALSGSLVFRAGSCESRGDQSARTSHLFVCRGLPHLQSGGSELAPTSGRAVTNPVLSHLSPGLSLAYGPFCSGLITHLQTYRMAREQSS